MPQQNQKTSFWESTACLLDGSQANKFRHSLTLVEVSVSVSVKRRLWAAGLTGRVAVRKPLLRKQIRNEACLGHEGPPVDYWSLEDSLMDWLIKMLIFGQKGEQSNLQVQHICGSVCNNSIVERMPRVCLTFRSPKGGHFDKGKTFYNNFFFFFYQRITFWA